MPKNALWILLTIGIISAAVAVLFSLMITPEAIPMPDCADALPGEDCWKELTDESNFEWR